jgi:hypothetical protein
VGSIMQGAMPAMIRTFRAHCRRSKWSWWN